MYSSPKPLWSAQHVRIILHQWICSNNTSLLLHKLKAKLYNISKLFRKRFGHSAPTPCPAFAEPATGSIISRKIQTLLQPVTAITLSIVIPMGATCSSERSVPTYKPTSYKIRRFYYEYYDTKNFIILWRWVWIIGIYNQNLIDRHPHLAPMEVAKHKFPYLMFCWPCIIVHQYIETNVMHFSFSLLRIKGLYMFRALLAHLQEALHKRHLVYCVRVMSVGGTRVGVDFLINWIKSTSGWFHYNEKFPITPYFDLSPPIDRPT
jgi:hypothetical protein